MQWVFIEGIKVYAEEYSNTEWTILETELLGTDSLKKHERIILPYKLQIFIPSYSQCSYTNSLFFFPRDFIFNSFDHFSLHFLNYSSHKQATLLFHCQEKLVLLPLVQLKKYPNQLTKKKSYKNKQPKTKTRNSKKFKNNPF